MSRYYESHISPNGPGDDRPTALQIIQDEDLSGKLSDKVIVITGCSSGIGVETARALATTGATLILTARDTDKASSALSDLLSPPGTNVSLVKMHLESLSGVRAGAASILSKTQKINILINNAGVMALPTLTLTTDGYETQFATNHLSHFLLFQLLLPTLLASSTPGFHSRVVNLSSTGHSRGGVRLHDYHFSSGDYTPFGAYGQSKTANIYMANEIERRYGHRGLHALSLNPGGIKTPMQRHIPPAFLEKILNDESQMRYFKSPEQGAATTVLAAIGKEWEGKGGVYLDNCRAAPPASEAANQYDPGYQPYIYDEAAEKRLWMDSLKMVGMEEDE
jgi:NAD(P)-dependent dehydrogenase (short-subunit alcohol dehydrogenase family)